jgi:hypothetical protein
MICPKCRTENEPGARFCANCGSKLTLPRTAVNRARATRKLICPNCGQENPAGSTFCESCGTKLVAQRPRSSPAPTTAAKPTQTAITPEKKPTSGAWWLLPIFLGWVGGLIGYLVVKDSDQSKAKGLLIFGIIWTIFWVIISIVGSIIMNFAVDF